MPLSTPTTTTETQPWLNDATVSARTPLRPPLYSTFANNYATSEHALRSYANLLVGGSGRDAGDLLQDAALRMYTKYEQFEPGTNFVAWGSRIMYHIHVSFHRKESRRHRLLDAAPAGTPWLQQAAAPVDADVALDRNRALELCARLSPKLREAFELRYRDYSYGEIAELLDIPISTAKSRVFLARQSLREYLADYYR